MVFFPQPFKLSVDSADCRQYNAPRRHCGDDDGRCQHRIALRSGRGGLQFPLFCCVPSMNILALDTSTEYCSVALWRDGAVYERGAPAGQAHSEVLLGMVDAVLVASGAQLAALDGIAYGQGPGSFTGLRIACAVAQGLAYPAGIPLAGIGTLHAMAAACGAPRVVCCLDARMQEVYHAAYIREGDEYVEISTPRVCAAATVPDLPGGAWTGCGSGFAQYGDVLRRRYGAALGAVDAAVHPQARDIARLAVPLLTAGRGVAAEDAAPLYIRDKVALKTAER
jgi:tRNA threonylcarbamoyladenosine biosynthesis protein TsaB